MPEGLIVKALSGYYYVRPEGLPLQSEAETIQCRARGIFKKNKVSPLVGDKVLYELTENGEGTVDEILPRSTELIRPPVANVRLAALVFSVCEPDLNLQLLDKFLVHVEYAGLDPLICLTKLDLCAESENAVDWVDIKEKYEKIGYRVYATSSKECKGLDDVKIALQGNISVFSGQSGVGKSSLLNALIPGLQLETNQISMRLGRGKHTTRHVELIPLGDDGWIADTPGFSQLDFMEIEAEELGSCFPEFQPLAEGCRFRGCLHYQEPGCKVMEAVEQGDVLASRYENYRMFLIEIKDRKRRY